MARELEVLGRDMKPSHFFINHSLSNREGDRIFFFARAGWSGQKGKRINHPFITQLFATFKNDTYLYMLLELSLGGPASVHAEHASGGIACRLAGKI